MIRGKFDVVMIDPPWPKKKGGARTVRPRQGRELAYKTLSLNDIEHLLVRDIWPALAPSAVVFLWTIDSFLHEAEEIARRAGLKLHARLVWDKENGIAPAFTVRYAHEYLLWCYRSPMRAVSHTQRGRYTTVLREHGREHSRKPETAYRMTEALYPNAARLDVFTRQERSGWTPYGDEIGFFSHQTT